jgi:hypothetical protein
MELARKMIKNMNLFGQNNKIYKNQNFYFDMINS